MKRAEWTPGRGQVQTTYLVIYENEKVNNVDKSRKTGEDLLPLSSRIPSSFLI